MPWCSPPTPTLTLSLSLSLSLSLTLTLTPTLTLTLTLNLNPNPNPKLNPNPTSNRTQVLAHPEHVLIFGLDANVYLKPNGDKQQGLSGFVAAAAARGYTSGWGDTWLTAGPTSYVARTFLQPQLQKATRWAETATKGDCNLKDFVLFPSSELRCEAATKDNTGGTGFLENTCLPTMRFPSDHALVTARLAEISPQRKGLRPPSLPTPSPMQVAGLVAAAAFFIGKAYLESSQKLGA